MTIGAAKETATVRRLKGSDAVIKLYRSDENVRSSIEMFEDLHRDSIGTYR
jgi:hypothetical protein